MKIRQLHINRFGHFQDCDLAFPGDGLQVIYGPNEAGKSTLLAFLHGMLFDFPARTPYDFGGQGELAGVATLQLSDGRQVEMRRRKGNKNKVSIKLDGLPTDIDDDGWLRLLDHADQGLFESVFAFGLDKLSQGEASLKHASLQSALFGGSLGGTTSPDKVLAEFSRQADDLFKKGGSRPAINSLLADIKELGKRIREQSLRPEKYQETEAAVALAIERAEVLHRDVEQLRRRHAKVEKLVRAWPKWWELKQRRGERNALVVPENVPSDARQRFVDLRKERTRLIDELAKHSAEEVQLSAEIKGLVLDPRAIAHRTEIKSCLELRKSYIEAKSDLPQREQQLSELRRTIDRELAELRPGWSHADLSHFVVDVATRAEIDQFAAGCRARASAKTGASARDEGDLANLERIQDELAVLGERRDVTPLAAVLADEADYRADQKQVEVLQAELAKLDRKVAMQCRKLAPPLSEGMSAPHELPVPRVEQINEFRTRISTIDERVRAESAALATEENAQRELEQALVEAVSTRAIPSLDERDAVRARRDAGWDLIRRQYILQEQTEAAKAAWLADARAATLPEGYEHAVRQADEVADQIYENADAVAKREALRQQIAKAAVDIEQRRRQLVDLQRQQTEFESQWRDLWRSCGFEPLTPEAMLSWLRDHETVCTTIQQRDELLVEQSRLLDRVNRYEQRLRAVCERTDEDVAVLLIWARETVGASQEHHRRTVELRRETQRLEKGLAKSRAELENLAAEEATAIERWQGVLCRLNLPTNWDAELARTVIDQLQATRVRLDSLPGEAQRIALMRERVSEFEQRVQTLCTVLDPQLLRDPAELAIQKLDEHVEQALEAQRKTEELSSRLLAIRTHLNQISTRQRQHDAEQTELFTQLAVTSEAEFLEVVGRAEQGVRLDAAIEQLQREIDLLRAGDNRDEFESLLTQGELPLLEGELRELVEELRQQEQLQRKAGESVGAARNEMSQLDGSAATALLAEELSHKRSRLAAEVDRYMPLVLARHVLSSAVARFEKDNQPEMIAAVTRLLERMTGGKYVGFDRTSGSKQNLLIRRADGVERTPDQLSTGTREQLYLAIRLAYVLQYCQQHQPLPIVIDDVLVNFDDQRARQTLTALRDISQTVQVLFFTCHPHMVDFARDLSPGLEPIELPGGASV